MKETIQRALELSAEVKEEEVANLVGMISRTFSIPTLEAVVKHYKAELQDIITKDLLEWMRENDQDEFANEQIEVKIKTKVTAKIDDEAKAFLWLEENEYGDLIKDIVDFPKGEFTDQIAQALDDLGASYAKKSSIHPQTLKKAISDRLEAGDVLPDEDDGFEVNYFDFCQIKAK